MIVLAVLAWPTAAAIATFVFVRVVRNRDKQQPGLPTIPDWACPMQCPPAMTTDSDGNPQEVWTA